MILQISSLDFAWEQAKEGKMATVHAVIDGQQ
jgi:hypothetical protein